MESVCEGGPICAGVAIISSIHGCDFHAQEDENEKEEVRRRDVKVDLAFGRGRRLANRGRGWKK